jgi:hypothetical protein
VHGAVLHRNEDIAMAKAKAKAKAKKKVAKKKC